ncbi:MAG TPA: cytochrome c [Chthoniobacterales bacterium]
MIKFFVGAVVGICLVLAAEYFYVARGGLNMATDRGPLPMERWLTQKALTASIGKSGDEKSPLPADETNLLAGAHIYQQTCAGCHGHLGQGPSGLSKRVYPHIPPLLPPGHGVTDDPVGAIHWVVKNGIRFSAMPSFAGKLQDNELWQVSLFLHGADKLPTPVQDFLHTK